MVQLNKYYFINLFSSLSALTFQISWAVTVNTFEWSEHLRVLLDTAVSCGRKFLLQKWLQCRSLVNWVYPLVVFGSNWPGEDFIFPENTSKRYRIGLKLTDFVHTRYKYFSEFIISFLGFHFIYSHLWGSRSKMTGLQTISYESLILLYYHQILDSFFLSTCFLSFKTYCFFYLHLINRIGLIYLKVGTSFFHMNNFQNMRKFALVITLVCFNV